MLRRLAHTVAIASLAGLGAGSAASALSISTSASPADGWRAIAPVGNLEGQPVTAVGLAWEAAHVGWNTSITFDDSDAAGWHTPVPRDLSRYGSIAINSIWADDPQGSGDTPAYFRKLFTLDFEPASASFGGDVGRLLGSGIDDDGQIYINGILVSDDRDLGADPLPFTDVTAYLHLGTNLIAVKAHDSVGADEHFELNLQINPIPEPSPVLLVALGIAALGGLPDAEDGQHCDGVSLPYPYFSSAYTRSTPASWLTAQHAAEAAGRGLQPCERRCSTRIVVASRAAAA